MGKLDNILVLLILLLIAFGNVYAYFSKMKASISGFSVSGEVILKNLAKLDFSTISFLIQWLLILMVILIFYLKFLKKKKNESRNSVKIKIKTESGKGKAHTDLDTLYDLIKNKKNMKISTIAKTFSINSDKALEWCKILEENNLAVVEYPAFSEPEVEIKPGVQDGR